MSITKRSLKNGGVTYKATLWVRGRPVLNQTFRRKVDAQMWLQHERSLITDQKLGRAKRRDISLAGFVEEFFWKRVEISANTAIEYRGSLRRHVIPKLGRWSLSLLTTSHWTELFSELRFSGMSAARINRIRTAVASVYKCAVREGFVRVSPLTSIPWLREKTRTIEYWSESEITSFLFTARKTQRPLFVLYWLAYESGMRISEILGLTWDCIDLNERRITVKQAWCGKTNALKTTTKSGHARVLPLSLELRNELMLRPRHSSGFIFVNEVGVPHTYSSIRAQFKTDCRSAGVKRIGIHGFRHTFASHFLMNGGVLADLKEILGHADYETTLRYRHLAKDYLMKKAEIVRFRMPLENVVNISARAFPEPQS